MRSDDILSKEMKRLIKGMFKYDLIVGFSFSIIISVFLTLKIGVIFFLGILVALINFSTSGIILEIWLLKNKKISIVLSYFLRICIVLFIAMFFINNLNTILAYIIGYIFHFVLLTIYWINERKGSD